MRATIIKTFVILSCVSFTTVFGQVKQAKIGDNPGVMSAPSSTVLELESTNKALLISRVASTASITNPVNGMMVYDIAARCVRLYQKGQWLDCGLTTANIVSGTGKVWMDRDLGAARVATSTTDFLAYGSLYQWGRRTDGHERITWTSATAGTAFNGTSTTLATTDTPANALFIIVAGDWRSPKNDLLWQGVSGTNNPCPSGFRLPTQAEIAAEFTANNITNKATAYSSIFKFPCNYINRAPITGSMTLSTVSDYWTSTTISTGAIAYSFGDTFAASNSNLIRAAGRNVRCIQN